MQLLRKLWEGWKAFGRILGNLVARVVLTLFYVTIFVPFGLGVRLWSDPLQIKTTPSSLWRPRAAADHTLAGSARQF